MKERTLTSNGPHDDYDDNNNNNNRETRAK